MPIRFLCEHCEAKLQVASRKAGSEQTCPRCNKVILIPEPEIAEAMLAMKASDRFTDGGFADDEFLDFALYDDEELVYDSDEDEALQNRKLARIDPNRISVPRMALYVQGALLGVVACVFFVFGVMAGRFTTSPEGIAAQADMRCRVVGQVSERRNNQTRPDAGSIVILVPKDRRLDPRPDVSQLRPSADLDPEDPDQQLIREIGGAIVEVSESGSFELVVSSPREYYMLVLSKNRQRPSTESITKEQRATMGAYFLPVDELILDRRFVWKEVRLTGTSHEMDPILF